MMIDGPSATAAKQSTAMQPSRMARLRRRRGSGWRKVSAAERNHSAKPGMYQARGTSNTVAPQNAASAMYAERGMRANERRLAPRRAPVRPARGGGAGGRR